jgi:N12 class adenine-specific DNA methylase
VESVELNEVSGRVNQLVNGGPGYNAIISPFEAVAARTPDETYDAVITNVPFGSVHDRGANRMLDDRYQDQSLETYFILRSLEKLKPGGLAAFIVPPRVVSGKGGRNEQLRIAASYSAEFLGAYRLPNSVFGAADADTITDVIVFRKFGRQALDKIAELKEQSPATLVAAKVQWTEFISGDYFKDEGRRFVLGEFVAKDPSKFRDVDRVVNNGSVADIAKMLRKFPVSRIDWALLEAAETQPIIYNDGDTMTLAGQTLEMRDGVWVAIGKPQESSRFDGVGQALSNAAAAVANKVDWATAKAYAEYLRNSSMELDMPDWLRLAHRDVGALDVADQPKYWAALTAGLAVVEVTRAHSDEPGFNYSEECPAVHEALATVAATAKKAPGAFSATAKQALVKVGIVYDRKQGYSALWMGQVGDGVLADKVLGTDAQVEAIKYRTKGITIPVEDLKAVYGEDFDPLTDDAWCVNADGTKATKADDYFTGNLGTFLERIDAEIAQTQGPLRDKLLHQKAAARERVSVLEPNDLRFNLFSPFVSMEEKAEFLRRFVHPAFVVGHNDDGEKVILCDISSPKNERERQLKRFAEYLKRGNLSTRTTESKAKSNPQIEESRRKMLREMAATANAQFDQWTKANPAIMDRMRQSANDPARVYFNEVDDNSAVPIEGMGSEIKLHGYQNAFVRKMARSFGGINAFDVGLGKSFSALASVQYVQSIGIKKKTLFVVPNSVMSNWRREAARAYASTDDCLFIGLDIGQDGKSKVDSGNYARDFNKVLENRHAKVFCTMEAFSTIPVKDQTVAAYGKHLSKVDPSYEGGDRTADSERAESKLADATEGTGTKSSAIPFFEDMGFDSIVIDEAHCFPAGTLVDGVPIEMLKVGDMVLSFNHETGQIERRAVLDVMARNTPDMVRVHLANGQSIVCTHNHPFYTERDGYLAAEFLSESDVVYINHSETRKHEPVQVHALPAAVPPDTNSAQQAQDGPGTEGVLQPVMLREGVGQEGADQPAVCRVLKGVRAESHAELEVREGACDRVLLHQDVCIGEQAQDIRKAESLEGQRCEETGCARCLDAQGELASDARSGGEESTQADCHRCAQGESPSPAGRQWTASVDSSPVDGGFPGLAGGVCGTDRNAQGQRVSDCVQTGPGASGAEDRRGNRRELPSGEGSENIGRQEDFALVPVGVVRVEVLERAGDDEFGGLCPGGLVYDITVDGNHNFFADGILVHNCYKNSKQTVEFSGAKFLSVPEASQRGLDMQMKAWIIRGSSPLGDGVLSLSATFITNSPIEIYSMLCLAVGEEKVHDLTMGARGADEFMEVMCDIEDDEEATIDGRIRPYRVFRGLQNVTLLRQAIGTVATIKNGNDVKADGDDLNLPDAPENAASVQLTPQAGNLLNAYKIAYRAARYTTGTASKDQEPPTEDELKIMNMVAEKFGEPLELIAHPFNLINKMTMVIADPELDERATFYAISPAQAELAAQCVAKFNALKKVELRSLPGPWTDKSAVVGTKVTKDGEDETVEYRIQVAAKVDGSRVVVDTMDTTNQSAFESIADKAGLELDCSIPPKYAALLENVRREEATPRSKTGRVKQLIFCDTLPSHNKLRRLLIKHCGFTAASVAIISGQVIKKAEKMQDIQDGFNAEGEENKYRIVIANEKAEVGINLQKGTQAIHHLTIGWTPDSQHQRNGRGVRQGNDTARVNIYHYDANGTFDTYKRRLTTRKADWIGAVMDRQGSNEVQVAGGLSNAEYDEMIGAMGNDAALDAISQRAEMKERAARAATARARQVVNIQTAAAQDEFQKRHPTAKSWVQAQAFKLYDMVKAKDVMDAKLGTGSMSAASTMKMESRRAELQASINGLAARIDASVQINAPYGYKGQRLATGVPILGLIAEGTHFTNAAKIREHFGDRLKDHGTVREGSELDQEWQAETAASEAMKAEALRDFERIAKQSGDAYPAELVAAYREGHATILDGQPVARGMFIRSKEGALMGVVITTTTSLTFPGGKQTLLSDIAPQGGKFIMFGTADYDQAINEAAAFEDGSDSITPEQRSKLYSTYVPEVAQRRTKPLLVNYSARAIKLPSPFFPYPINAGDDRLSETTRAIGATQTVITSWDGDQVMIDSVVDVEVIKSLTGQDVARIATLADRIRAGGAPIPLNDYAIVGYNSSKSYNLSDARKALEGYAQWPADARSQMDTAVTVEDLRQVCKEMAAKAFGDFVTGMEGYDFDLLAPSQLSSVYYRRQSEIKRAADLAAMQADLAARKAEADRLAAERAAAGEQVAPVEPVAPELAAVDVNRSTMKLSPWTSKTGEQRVYFNRLPGATKSDNIYTNDGGDGAVRYVAGRDTTTQRRDQLMVMIDRELTIINGGEPVTSFAKLWEMSGVKPVDLNTPGAAGLDPKALIGITGRTRENVELIKRASLQCGSVARFDLKRLQWTVPAAAWDIIVKEKPEAAQELQTVAP